MDEMFSCVFAGMGWCASGDDYYSNDEEGYMREIMQHMQ